MPTLRAVALVISLFSAHIGSGNFQNANNEAKDLVASATTVKNETKKEDKLAKILPLVTFDCTGRTEGYYADVQFDCEAFHYCKTSGERFTFVCPPKSRFNQKHMICDYDRYGLKLCHNAEKYFNLNENLYPKTTGEKQKDTLPTATTKAKEKIKLPALKKEVPGKEEKPIKPKVNKSQKLEKTYIVTEYYDHHVPTTERPLTDDASPKIYKWYTPPVTSDSPSDEVEYDDSIRHQYEYPDDYHEDYPYYDHSKEHPKTQESYEYDKDKESYDHKGHSEEKPNKDELKEKRSSGETSQEKVTQHYDHNSKQSQSRDNEPDALQDDGHYENLDSKEAAYSDKAQLHSEHKETQSKDKDHQDSSSEYQKPKETDNNRDEQGYIVPLEETQTNEDAKVVKSVEELNPTSEEQSRERPNYYHRPQLTEESDPEGNYQEESKDDRNQNYAVVREENYKPQPYELEDGRIREVKGYVRNDGGGIIILPESQHPEGANNRNHHARGNWRYQTPESKVNKYEILSNPEENKEAHSQLGYSDASKSKAPSPQRKSKTEK